MSGFALSVANMVAASLEMHHPDDKRGDTLGARFLMKGLKL